MFEFDRVVFPHDVFDQLLATRCRPSVAIPPCLRSRDHDDPLVLGASAALSEPEFLETLHRTRRRGGIDSQCFGEIAHSPGGLLDEQIESVHLPDFESIFSAAEEVVDEATHRGSTSHLAPGSSDAHGHLTLRRVMNVGCDSIGGGHYRSRVQPQQEGMTMESPLHALGVIASQSAMVTPTLRHVEMFTLRGLVTLLWHEVSESIAARPAAIVACGGAMGGLLGPCEGLYQELGDRWSARGVPVVRVSYREPNELDSCCLDVAAAVQMTVDAGAERVVVIGHSFGGAVAVRVGVAMDEVAGVVTCATQSAGCEIAAGLRGRPLLLFHGDADEILPSQCSEIVAAMAGSGDVVICPGDGHLLVHSGSRIIDTLEQWIPATLGLN